MSEKNIPEYARPTTIHGGDPVLAERAKAATGVNVDFNRGIMHGPWKAPRDEVARAVEDGYTEDEAQTLYGLRRIGQAARANTYPAEGVAGTESGQIMAEAGRGYDALVKRVGRRVSEQAGRDI